MKLISLSVRRRRTDYEPDRGDCFACARCFEYCPNELVRRGLMPAAAPALGGVANPSPRVLREWTCVNRIANDPDRSAALAGDWQTRRNWRMTAWVAGVFSVLVGLTMIFGRLSIRAEDPLKSPQLRESKEKLRLNPTDEQIKQRIRQLDLQLRQRYFRQLSQMESGVYLLLGGVAVFVLAVKQGARCQRQLPMPKPRPDAPEQSVRSAARARWSVAASGAAIGAFLFILSLGLSAALPKADGRGGEIAWRGRSDRCRGIASHRCRPRSGDAASAQELKQNWPRFRGPGGGGVSPLTNVPAAWDTKTGAGIAWKVPAPASGFNSPIVWGDRVFLSGGDARKREVICLDGKTGQVLWRQPVANVPGAPAQPAEVPESTGYAAATMATDGRRVYVFFANGDCAAFTLEGKPAWSKSFGALKNPYGHATSLATWRDRLIVQLDQGDSEDNKSKLYALDGRTGQIVWQRPRKVGASWATPIVIEAAGKGAGHHAGRPQRHRLRGDGWHGALAGGRPQRRDHALAGVRRRLAVRGQPVGEAAGDSPGRAGRCDQDPCRLDLRRQRAGCHQPPQQRRAGLHDNDLGHADVPGREGRQEAMGS